MKVIQQIYSKSYEVSQGLHTGKSIKVVKMDGKVGYPISLHIHDGNLETYISLDKEGAKELIEALVKSL